MRLIRQRQRLRCNCDAANTANVLALLIYGQQSSVKLTFTFSPSSSHCLCLHPSLPALFFVTFVEACKYLLLLLCLKYATVSHCACFSPSFISLRISHSAVHFIYASFEFPFNNFVMIYTRLINLASCLT